MKRFMMITAAMLCASTPCFSLQAGLLDDVIRMGPLHEVMSVPRQLVNVELNRITSPVLDLSRAIPTAAEVTPISIPRRDRIVAYPLDVVRFGLRVHPASRILRTNLGRL